MTEDERRAWVRMLLVLLVAAGVRGLWSRGDMRAAGPGMERNVAAALDTVLALEADQERRSRPLAEGELLDPNRADAADLDRLPGVGPATAAAILTERERAAFVAIDDLLRVRGIGPSTLARLKSHLYLAAAPRSARAVAGSSDTRIDLNRADSVELLTLPGVGPALAGRIVRARAEGGRFERIGDLARVRGIGSATIQRLRDLVRVR